MYKLRSGSRCNCKGGVGSYCGKHSAELCFQRAMKAAGGGPGGWQRAAKSYVDKFIPAATPKAKKTLDPVFLRKLIAALEDQDKDCRPAGWGRIIQVQRTAEQMYGKHVPSRIVAKFIIHLFGRTMNQAATLTRLEVRQVLTALYNYHFLDRRGS